MPERYHIHTVPTPGLFRRVGRHGPVDWREDCSRCKNCVKRRCLYQVYETDAAHSRDETAPVEAVFGCKACLSCVQGCTKGLLALALNPEFQALGDSYWKPDLLATTWDQAESGRIPVSGAGYRGPFSGPGFDSMWTDMSEIVRPTRDGIHGREYINTSVDIGPKPMRLDFDANGTVKNPAALVEVQFPAILDLAPWGDLGETVLQARVAAAAALRTLAVVPGESLRLVTPEQRRHVVPLFENDEALGHLGVLAETPLVEIADGPASVAVAKNAQERLPRLLVAVRLPLRPDSTARVLALFQGGVRIFHLCADHRGREGGAERPPETWEPQASPPAGSSSAGGTPAAPRFVKEVLREVHGALVREGVRDEVTVIAGGGIALAEHLAKAIICGADLVSVDVALLVALGCRVCAAGHAEACPVEIGQVPARYATQRMVNLMGAWHNQLIEVLGAMGIREVRRLRGEAGRAMFLEDLERDAFKELARGA